MKRGGASAGHTAARASGGGGSGGGCGSGGGSGDGGDGGAGHGASRATVPRNLPTGRAADACRMVKGRCTAQSARPQLLLGRRTLASCESTGRTPRRAAPASGNPSVQGRDTRQGLIATAQLSYTRQTHVCCTPANCFSWSPSFSLLGRVIFEVLITEK